jgi:type II secretory pathway pseudopilin PulG
MSTLKTLIEGGAVAVVIAVLSVIALVSVVNPSAAEVAQRSRVAVQAPVFYGSR